MIGLINTPLEKRKVEWFNDIANRLKKLEDENHSFTIDSIANNQEFITIFTHASQLAIRNHEEEKLEALRNIVINTANKVEIGQNMQMIFLSYVDLMTPWHIYILKYFQNPTEYLTSKGIDLNRYFAGGASGPLEDYYPDLKGKREFYDLILYDLKSKGLISDSGVHTMVTASGMVTKRTTTIGDDFIKFIS